MECRSCIEALTALMDDELGTTDRSEVEGHLESCPACSAEFESLRYSYRLVDSVAELHLEADLWNQIQPQLPRRSFSWDLGFFLGRPWVPAAAGLFIVLAVVSAFLILPAQNHIEEDFVVFMKERERISLENADILFGESALSRYQSRRNPFVQPVSLSNRNPFQE